VAEGKDNMFATVLKGKQKVVKKQIAAVNERFKILQLMKEELQGYTCLTEVVRMHTVFIRTGSRNTTDTA